jgi:hypothetical protein
MVLLVCTEMSFEKFKRRKVNLSKEKDSRQLGPSKRNWENKDHRNKEDHQYM